MPKTRRSALELLTRTRLALTTDCRRQLSWAQPSFGATRWASAWGIPCPLNLRALGLMVKLLPFALCCSLFGSRRLGVFNSNATDVMDYAVMRAGQLGIRLIVPLIDNYHYFHGGKWVFTSWRNISDENAFFTNEQVIGDFEQYITHLLNRTNIYTGVRLSEDPTVLAWETGNEISPPVAWTQRISAFLKTLAPQQLVLDGTNGINTAALGISTVDLYTQHFYPGPNVAGVLQDAAVVTAAGKVFFVGEFGWKTDQLEPFIEAVEASPLVSGDLYWSLFPHAIDWGFVQHGDTFTLHYPGDSPDLAVAVGALRAHAFNMSGRSLPQPPTPQAPVITGVSAAPGLAWRGSAGASTYDIDVAPAAAGPWRSLCTACATDNQTPWPLPNGISPELFFRVRGTTVNGTSGPWSAPAQG